MTKTGFIVDHTRAGQVISRCDYGSDDLFSHPTDFGTESDDPICGPPTDDQTIGDPLEPLPGPITTTGGRRDTSIESSSEWSNVNLYAIDDLPYAADNLEQHLSACQDMTNQFMDGRERLASSDVQYVTQCTSVATLVSGYLDDRIAELLRFESYPTVIMELRSLDQRTQEVDASVAEIQAEVDRAE